MILRWENVSRRILRICDQNFQKVRHKSKGPETPADYCLDMVRKHDHENFLCSLLLPKHVRGPAFAIRAFNIEVAKVADRTREKHIAEMRMVFWEETLDKVFKDKAPKHPVALELSRVVNQYKLLKRNLMRLISARKNQLGSSVFENKSLMEKYAEETVSPVYYLLLQVAGIKNVNADHAASHIGKAQGLSNLIRGVPHNASQRVCLLPQDVLVKHSVSQESIFRGKSSKEFKDAVFDIASEAKLHLDKARTMKESVPKDAHVLFLPTFPVEAFLENLRQVDFDIFDPRIHVRSNNLGWTLFWNKIRSQY